MSAFDLGGDDRRALLEHARLNVASQLAPEDSELEKTATGAGMGVARGLAESGRTVLKLAGAAPVAYDAAKSVVTGKDTTSAQDAFFKAFTDDVGKGAIEYWTPQAEHTNKAGDIIGGVASGLTQFAASGFNPFLFGAQAGLNTQGSLADQGVDLGTSSLVGGVTTVASAAGAFLPPSVGGTLAKKLVSGAAINLVAGAAERAVDGSILQGSGYEEQAKQFDWSDPTAAAVDALMGSAFSVAPGSLPASKVKELQDSVLTVASANHAALDVAPGIPVTPGSAAIHHKALSTAIEQIVKGEPVDVGERINKAEFSLRDELPSIKQLRGDLTDLLHEDGRNQFAQQLLDHQGADGPYKTHEEARFVVDQFGAGIQKLHGAGVSMDRLSQLRTSFGKPSEDGAVFNQGNYFYHGTKAGNEFDQYDPSMAGKGAGANAYEQGDNLYLTNNRDAAQWFGNRAQERALLMGDQPMPKRSDIKGDVLAFELKPDAKIMRVDSMPRHEGESNALMDKARADGYDAISFPERGFDTVEGDPAAGAIAITKPDTVIPLHNGAVARVKQGVFNQHGNSSGDKNSIDTKAAQGVDSNGEVNNHAITQADKSQQDIQRSGGESQSEKRNTESSSAERRRLRKLSQQRFRDDAEREFGQPVLNPRSVEPGYRQVTRAGNREVSASHWSDEAAGGNSGTPESAIGVWAATKESSAAAYGDVLRDYIFHFHNPLEIPAEIWQEQRPTTFKDGKDYREMLLKYGYDGIIITGHDQYNHVIALHPDSVVKVSDKRQSENFVDRDALPTMDVSYDQKGGDAFARNINGDTEAPQGQINFGIDGEKLNAVISLFGTADKSTALHELSHNFLEIYKHLNQFEDTPASIREDYAEMRRLIGADDMGSSLKTEHHERFAQAFEQYTREGKAPTPALKRAFEHFKEWMTAIYQRAADLGAPINDDMRTMFDKMLGKESEVNHFDPLLKNPDVQNELRRMAKNAGWAEVGGKVIMDENRVVTGRTAWIPKEEWYAAGMGSQADVERAVGKAIRGEKLGKKQQSIVQAMLESPAHDMAREDLQINDAMSKTSSGETPEQKAARMAEMDAFFDSIPEAAGVSAILNSAQDLSVPQDDGSFMSAREMMESMHAELQEADAMPKVYDAAINCFLRG